MLSEGLEMQRSLERAGITPEKKHPRIDKVPRTTGPCLRVCLSAEGGVTRVTPVSEDEQPQYWQFSLSNGSTFPVTRVREPLMERGPDPETGADTATEPTSGLHRLNAEIEQAVPKPLSDGELGWYRKLYREKGEISSLRTPLEGKSGVETVREVIRRFQKAFPCVGGAMDRGTVEATLTALRESAVAYLREYADDRMADAVRKLLFDAASGGGNTVQLAFDTEEGTIYTADIRARVVDLLLNAGADTADEGQESVDVARGICSLTGQTTALQTGTFTKVRLPFIFEKGLPLFSMNTKEAECNSRYHRKDAELCPVAPAIALSIQDAYGYLLKDELKGKTWQVIASDLPDSRDLLITYPDSNPNFEEELAEFFNQSKEPERRREMKFRVAAGAVCKALRAEIRDNPPEKPKVRVAIRVIRKASEGTGFVLFSVLPEAEEIIRGAEWWDNAGDNLPFLRFPVFRSGEAGVIYLAEPLPILPGDIVSLLREAWTEAKGTAPDKGRANKLRGVSFAIALSLMIEHPYPRKHAAQQLLSAVLNHAGPLLIRIGACQWRNDFTPFENAERKKALRAVSLLGLTLNGLDSHKENYMHSSAFLIGRFLALADRLHYDYCIVVRDGQIPPSLIGNAAMATALKSPLKAFVLLSERMPVYIGWAKTAPADGHKHSRFAKAVLKEYLSVADQLAPGEIPEACTDVDKAHLLLGYLASTRSGGRSDEDTPDGVDTETTTPVHAEKEN